MQLFQEKKLWHRCFTCKFSEIFKKTYFVEHACSNTWVKWTKNIVFTKSIRRKIVEVLFSAVADMWTYNFSKKWLRHWYFSMKTGKFYRTSILQTNAGRLLLISCDIFSVLLTLSMINQFSHSMEIMLVLCQ